MDFQARKLSLIQEFLNIQSEEILIRIENVLNNSRTSEQSLDKVELNKRIDLSMEDSKKGKLTDSKELLKEISEWH